MVSEKKEKGKKKKKKKPAPMDPVLEEPAPPAAAPVAAPAAAPVAAPAAAPVAAPAAAPVPGPAPDSATSATGGVDTQDTTAEVQQIEARLQAALLLAASDLKVDRAIVLGLIGDTSVLYQEHLADQMDLKDVIIAAYRKGHQKVNTIKTITNGLAEEVQMGAHDVFSLLNWGPVYDRWAVEDGVDYLKLEVMMRDTLNNFINFQKDAKIKAQAAKPQAKLPPQAKPQENPKTPPTRLDSFKPTVNAEDAKSKREKALEDRQNAKRDKKLKKARGIMQEQMQATEKVPTDDEEDNVYGPNPDSVADDGDNL